MIHRRYAEVQRLERRIQQKEESIDRKLDNLEKKEEAYQQKLEESDMLSVLLMVMSMPSCFMASAFFGLFTFAMVFCTLNIRLAS